MNETKYVAISTQKGGAGKTTLTVLVASYLHYVKGYNVAVVDCDFPQYSVHDMRKRDLKAIMEDEYYKSMAYEQLKRLEKNPYPIKCSRAEDAIKTAEQLCESHPNLDFVFFDLPGTINNVDVVTTIAKMDYIFTPIIADRVVMESSIKFATVINEQMISTGKSCIKGLYLVWNMVDGREKSELYKAYDKSRTSSPASAQIPSKENSCHAYTIMHSKYHGHRRRRIRGSVNSIVSLHNLSIHL